MPSRILLVDDDPSLLDALALSFEDEGYDVDTAPAGDVALVKIANERPDIVISDVNMPGLDGFSLCRRLREKDDSLPIILLTSRDNEIDEALGLELGADDYVAKPFSTRVLTARVKALLRRQALRQDDDEEVEDEAVELGEVRLDPERLEVTYRGEPLTMTVTEFRMVEAFVRRPGIVLSRDRLMELVRGDDSVVADRIIDTYVRRLRRKFEKIDDSFDLIETVIGAGYRWKKP
jgi:DNA-binding response OmpR family regulator